MWVGGSMWLVLQYLHLHILTNLHWSINELLSFMMLKMSLNYIQCLINFFTI
jgi:hypothetical protein